MALSPVNREKLKTLYNVLADRVLEPGDPAYVDTFNRNPEHDAVEEIATEIDWQSGGGVSLLTGQRGTGKSTELKRLQRRLRDLGMVAFYADLSEYLLLTKEVEITDFLISVAGAISEKIEERYGASPGQRSYWDRLSGFLQTRVEIDEIGTTLVGVELKASLKNDPDFKLKIQERMRGHVAQLVREAHAFIAEAVRFVREREGNPNCKVVLLVDSVERIRGVGSEAMRVYESVRNLFFGHAEHLRIPMLHVVYTIPPYLSVLAAGTGTLMGGAATRRLVSAHIFENRSRRPDPAGLALMRTVVGRRYPNWSEILSGGALDRLSLSSGGDLREFFRLIRLCLTTVRDDEQLPLTEQTIVAAENNVRGEMLPIPADHLDWLQKIARTHDTCLPSDTELPTLAHFLDNRLVLNYRNGDNWYDIHPLLRGVVDAHERTPDA
ncbi:MAG: hypothetical protein E6Q50_14810 [Lysobacter sp.]|nr:MAG: hypothetical protein E6Q50_14810 [Lysobacter sp.]